MQLWSDIQFHFTNYFNSFSFLLSEKLLFEGISWSYAFVIWFLHFLHLKFFFASSESKFLLHCRSIGFDLSPSRFDYPLDGFCWILIFIFCCQEGTFVETFLRVLPVHWYHLFVSIRYHKKTIFSRRNIVRSNENVIVQNTDLRHIKTNPDWQCNRDLIW